MCARQDIIRLMGNVGHAIQIHHIMESIVSVIMDSMGIEINALNVMRLVDNALGLKIISVSLAPISVMIWLMANAQEIYPVQLDSILMADNVDNAQPIVLNASLIPSAIDAWMDLNFNPPNFSA